MEGIIIKGVGKKIIVNDINLEISKTIGKNMVIPIGSIKKISFQKGTLAKNGTIEIMYNINNKEIKETIMFYYSQNSIVSGFIDWINNAEDSSLNMPNEKVGLFKQISEEAKMNNNKKLEEKKNLKNKLEELDEEGIPYCPKCHSTSVQYLDRRKQLSVGRAVVGGVLLGGTGAVLGGVTSKKYKGKLKCLKCGKEWKI